MSEINAQTLAEMIQTVRAGKCPACGQFRIESRRQTSGSGFGQVSKIETYFVCQNPDCQKCGKA